MSFPKKTLLSSLSDNEEENSTGNKSKKVQNVLQPSASIKSENCTVKFGSLDCEQTQKYQFDEKSEDTTCTLKHLLKGENISELIKGSTIFVNDFELRTARSICKSQTDLARTLLRIVFKETALKNYSLTGKKANGLGKTEKVKPGLNSKGVDAILLYVEAFRKKMDWKPKDKQLVKFSMSSKFTEIQNSKK